MISPDFPLILESNVRMSSGHLTSILRLFALGLLVLILLYSLSRTKPNCQRILPATDGNHRFRDGQCERHSSTSDA